MSDSPCFLGREREVAALTRILTGSQPALVIVYGRRRVGKSTLLRRVVRHVDAVYYQATRVADVDNQDLFKRAITAVLGDDPAFSGLHGWKSLFHYLGQYASKRNRGLVVVLDEFPYLCEGNSGLPCAGHGRTVLRDAIAPRLDEYMGEWFEAICRQWVRFYANERLATVAHNVGKIWAGDYDIDVAGELLDGQGVAGQCKWRRDPTGANTLRELHERIAANSFYSGRSKGTVRIIFSRSSPTPELKRIAADDPSVVLISAADLVESRRRKR